MEYEYREDFMEPVYISSEKTTDNKEVVQKDKLEYRTYLDQRVASSFITLTKISEQLQIIDVENLTKSQKRKVKYSLHYIERVFGILERVLKEDVGMRENPTEKIKRV